MRIWEILLIGVGLSMDAAAVSMTNTMIYTRLSRQKLLAIPVFFGFFQGLMPLLGYYTGFLFSDFISRYAGIIGLLILGVIGGKMIKDGICDDPEESFCSASGLTYRMLFFQAIATSIDAFAVGVSFAASGANIALSASLIAVTTFVCSLLALFVGKRFGNMLGSKAQILGGVILIAIGIKGMFS